MQIKVCKISENGLFAELIYAPESYRLSDKLHEDYPWAKERLSMGHPYDITTNIFEKLPEIFKETYQIKEEEVRFYGRYKKRTLLSLDKKGIC